MAEPRDRLAPDNLRLIIDAYCSSHDLDSFPWIVDPHRVEVPVVAPLYETRPHHCLCGHTDTYHEDDTGHLGGDGSYCTECPCPRYQTTIEFLGKLDLLGKWRRNPKVLCVVDQKTTWRLDQAFVRQYLNDSQLSGYLWLAGIECGVPAHTLVGYINAFEIAVVPFSSKKCPTHGVPYSECGPMHIKSQVIGPIERTEEQIARWKADAISRALAFRRLCYAEPGQIDDIPTEGTFTGACRNCEAAEWCTAGRPPKQLPKMFTRRRWDPRAHAFGAAAANVDPLVYTIDNSTLKAAFTCSTQALVRYGWDYTTPEGTGPLFAGTLMHSALEGFFKTGDSGVAIDYFERTLEAAGANDA